MTRRLARTALSLAAFVSLGALVVGCKDDVTPGPPPVARDPIVIGVSLGLTGSSKSSADAITTAIRVAESQVNAVGGIGGRRVQFLFVNDGDAVGDALRAKIQSDLLDRGAIAVIGPIRSAQVEAAAALTVENVPLISPSATAVSLSGLTGSDGKTWVFRTIPSDTFQVKAMVRFARSGVAGRGGNCSKLAIAYADDLYGQGFFADLKVAWRAAGGTVVSEIPLPEEPRDFRPEVLELVAEQPECLALISVEDVGGAFALALHAEKESFAPGFFAVGADGLYNDGFLEQSRTVGSDPSTSRSNGFFGTVAAPNLTEDPAWSQYMYLHRQAEPGVEALYSYVAAAYDAAALVLLARAASNSDDPAALRDAIEAASSLGERYTPASLPDGLIEAAAGVDVNYDGASGKVDFTAAGDVAGGFLIWTVENGVFADVGNLSQEDILAP